MHVMGMCPSHDQAQPVQAQKLTPKAERPKQHILLSCDIYKASGFWV